MSREDFLKAQLAQAEAALEATKRVKEMAEYHYRQMLDALRQIAITLLTEEWNLMIRDHPDACQWPPDRLVAWILKTGQEKLNRLRIMAGSGPQILERQGEEIQQLRQENRRLTDEKEALTEQLQQVQLRLAIREQELQQLQTENEMLHRLMRGQARGTASGPEIPAAPAPPETADGEKPAGWLLTDVEFAVVEALGIIGSTGLSLRESVARALGRSPRSGATGELFQSLKDRGWIAEDLAASEVIGRPPRIIRLTGEGKAAYRALFGTEPVEPEVDRLLRRHKSQEQVVLALQARQALEEAGAEMVDLLPEPIPLPGHRRPFEVDLVAVLDGHKIFVECERATSKGEQRLDKWSAYAQVTKDFYFFVPNREVLNRLVNELDLWASRRLQDAAGVTLRICQLSSTRKDSLWHYEQPLGGKMVNPGRGAK